ncbi:hypothetical protein ACFFX0_19330 [Citricoccus parietis]|uniref:Uncharacterized protein n=1 Tax=Citricoccus parietis TaxID=592307 RepID=A0ABV5G2S1_9MICC
MDAIGLFSHSSNTLCYCFNAGLTRRATGAAQSVRNRHQHDAGPAPEEGKACSRTGGGIA